MADGSCEIAVFLCLSRKLQHADSPGIIDRQLHVIHPPRLMHRLHKDHAVAEHRALHEAHGLWRQVALLLLHMKAQSTVRTPPNDHNRF